MAAAFVFARQNMRRQRVFRPRVTNLDHLCDQEVIERYRLDKASILYLCDTIGESLERKCSRSQSIPPMTQILICLRLLAKGDFFSETGDLHGVSRSTVCRVFDSFVDSLNKNLNNIKFPRTQESQRQKKIAFYRKCRIPGVLGAIDGTLIPMLAQSEQEEVYRCRKGFHALNVQAIVDTELRFLDVVAKWPGSQHDSAIFNSSGIQGYLETHRVGTLLGDSGYPLRKYLLTPKLQPSTPQEERYNLAHKKGRVVVERAFGLLKSRFRCLHKSGGCLPFTPKKSAKVVAACTRLHNLCCDRGVPAPEGDMCNDVADDRIATVDAATANTFRQQIINLF